MKQSTSVLAFLISQTELYQVHQKPENTMKQSVLAFLIFGHHATKSEQILQTEQSWLSWWQVKLSIHKISHQNPENTDLS